MSLARRAPKRPAAIDSNDDKPGIDNFCSVRSGDEAARVAGSAVTNSDVTVSEESDSGSGGKGELALDALDFGSHILIAKALMQMRLCMRVGLFFTLRRWTPIMWLLVACGCMHALDARISAKRFGCIALMSAHTLVRSRSSAASARTLQAELTV
jgi:hypothetical protein